MCGITGCLSKDSLDPVQLRRQLSTMNATIVHRGPDDEGAYIDATGTSGVAMGMRRLSIIDLDTGTQPIFSADGKKVIVFNGEIYNYKALKAELAATGATFATASDTEVILKIYERDGIDGFKRLDGMFAFSIYDKAVNKVFIARDFFGEKPLYYTHTGGTFYWASEIKAILAVMGAKPPISKQGLNLFFQLNYIPAPYTIYEGVHKLEANHCLCYDLNLHQYDITLIDRPRRSFPTMSKEQATRMTEELVRESVLSRSVSDVPIGAFLSGGVDSSIVSLCMSQQSDKKIDTFSIGFDKKSFDETDKSRLVAKLIGSHHHEFVISEKDLLLDLSDILANFDEPFADSSALPTYIVSNRTKRHVKVALTGDGGDEVFGGYNKYYIGRLNEQYTAWVPKPLHQAFARVALKLLHTQDDRRGIQLQLSRLLKAINYEGDFYYNIISLGFQDTELASIIQPALLLDDPLAHYKKQVGPNHKTLLDFRNIDRLLSLEGDMLVKVDRTSMLNSLECRAPFLNKTLWDFTAQLPDKHLINGWDKKHILKQAFKGYFPDGFLDKSKQGFGVPVGDWLRATLRDELRSYIDKDFIDKQGIFHYDAIARLVNDHLDGKIDNTFKVWSIYCFQKWYAST